MTKKKQSTTCSLQTFLAATDTADSSWVDENHELPTAPVGRERPQAHAPREARRAPPMKSSKSTKEVPRDPPFTVFVGQLPFEVDVQDLGLLFFNRGCAINSEPRIVKDADNKSKGFGYVEFMDRESMIKALELDGYQLKNRSICVDVAEDKKESQHRSFLDRSSMGGRGRQQSIIRQQPPSDDSKLMASNWRSDKTSPTDTEPPLERSSPSSGRTSPMTRGPPPSQQRDTMQRRGENDTTNSRSEFRRRDRSSPPRQSRGEYRDASMTSPRGYNQDHSSFHRSRRSSHSREQRQTPRSFHREDNRPSNDHPTPESTSQRPKLDLAPRTLPLISDSSATPLESTTPSSATSSSSTSKRNPFGAARPVDTTHAIKKIEEKLEALKVVSQSSPTSSIRPTSPKKASRHSSRRRSSSKSARSRSRSRTNEKEEKQDSLVSPDPDSHDPTTTSPSVEN